MFIERHFKIDTVLDVQCREIRRYAETPRRDMRESREHSARRACAQSAAHRHSDSAPRGIRTPHSARAWTGAGWRVSLQSKKSEQHTQRTQPHAAARTHRSEERSEPSRKKRAQPATADSKSSPPSQLPSRTEASGASDARLAALYRHPSFL